MPAVLDHPDPVGVEIAGPDQQRPEPLASGWLGAVRALVADGIDCGGGVRVLVRINPDRQHPLCPFNSKRYEADCWQTVLSRGDATLLSGHASRPWRRRATPRCLVSPGPAETTKGERVSPAPSETIHLTLTDRKRSSSIPLRMGGAARRPRSSERRSVDMCGPDVEIDQVLAAGRFRELEMV